MREEDNPIITYKKNSWKSIGPLVVSAMKLGALEPLFQSIVSIIDELMVAVIYKDLPSGALLLKYLLAGI